MAATTAHCAFCFESLAAHLENRKPMTLDDVEASWTKYLAFKKQSPTSRLIAEAANSASTISTPSSGSSTSLGADTPATSTSSLSAEQPDIVESPLFVTWNTVSSVPGQDSALRGCIGTFEAQELDEGLSSYALTSALHDMRFDPITKRELPSLEVAVTLLHDFEDCEDAMDWEIGTHGIRISFSDRGRRYGSTYLPDVALEQGWTKEQALVSLMRKAGWVGRKDKWQDVDLKVVRYQGEKIDLEYQDYKKWRDWVAATKDA
ncbi:AMMECR1 domain-containing protein [Xylariaceae sp. FL1019]|nr:AMMECR1 domain-containing protein [Xylariaceae sp. FL1019]